MSNKLQWLAPNRVDIVRFGLKGVLTALKRVYRVKMSPYLYNVKNFLPYSMLDVTNIPLPPNADTTSSLCPMGLRGQTDKHSIGAKHTPTSRSKVGSDTICNDPFPTV